MGRSGGKGKGKGGDCLRAYTRENAQESSKQLLAERDSKEVEHALGGNNTLPQWKDQAQSVTCHNGFQVWIHAAEYRDAGGQLIKRNVDDLKIEPYRNNHAIFSQNIKALWVSKR